VTTALAVLVAVVIGGGYIFYRASQNQYYVTVNDGQVVIYRGVNYSILGISLFSLHTRTGIPLARVPENYQQTVTNSEGGGSLSQAQTTVANVRAAVSQCQNAYLAQEQWVTKENAYQAKLKQYQAKLAAARKHPTGGTQTNPGPPPVNPGPPPVNPGPPPLAAGQRPPSAGGLCALPGAYDIAPSVLTPAASGSS
jgi:protein phosphatase